jgi:hypothetical protein
MNRKLAVGLVLALAISTASLVADSPHLIGQVTVQQSGNTLTITASIAGLGGADSATFGLVGTVDLFSRCYNRGGNKPQADNKQETLEVNSTATFPVSNGRTNVQFVISPLSSLSCPGSQVVVIESFTRDLDIVGEGVTLHVP